MSESKDKPAAREDLEARLRRLVVALDSVDPAAPQDAMAHLTQDHPFDGPEVTQIFELCRQGLDDGWLAPHDAGPHVRFGRLDKDMGGYAVDAVVMANAAGRGHTHTRGELNMCFPLEGEPRFDGHEPGWVVFAPGSHHIPTVEGGTMLFLYFTPGGAVVWDPIVEGESAAD
ncbi:MAG: DUF4863 family protein [Planctomycetota bacterium]|nr:DUF4863 family protein [Planctomycetota bacterium]